MRRIDTDTRAIDLHGAGKDGWRDGVGAATLAPTRARAEWFNQVQEEIARAIELAGLTIDGTSHTQLHRAMQRARRSMTVAGQVFRTSSSDGSEYRLRDVCFGPGSGLYGEGIFFAVGNTDLDAAIWSSYETLSWNKQTSAPVGRLMGCAHGGAGALGSRRLVVVGLDLTGRPTIHTSEDGGGEFILRSPPAGISGIAAYLTGVCWHDRGAGTQRWVACGRRSGATTALIYGTEDATAWTLVTPDAGYTGHFTRCISTARGAASGSVIVIGDDGEIQRSVDGITYARVHSNPSLGTLTSIAKLDNGTLIVATSQARTILRSVDDGLTWAEVLTPSSVEAWGVTDAVVELVTQFQDAAVAFLKDATSDVRIGIISYDGGETWTDAFRPATHSTNTSTDPWWTPVAACGEGGRFVTIGGLGGETALVFSSVVPNTIALEGA